VSVASTQVRESPEGPAIVWLRQDLRLADNPALSRAASGGRAVIPVFILDEAAEIRPQGGASKWWLNRSLAALESDLAAHGSRLILRRGPAARVLEQLVAETGAGAVVWNRLHDAASITRDRQIKAALTARGVEAATFNAATFNAALLNEPWEIANGSGQPYRVFTPYWRVARARIVDTPIDGPSSRLAAPDRWPAGDRLEGWGLHPTAPDWSTGFGDWTPGEAGAMAALERFLDEALDDYADQRDRPAMSATSRLSPHLHFGEIGPRQVWRAVQSAVAGGQASERQADRFLAELGWREFNHHILFHQPRLPTASFRPEFDRLVWRDDEAGFAAWARGQTGYPMVDAGMRELWTTGTMHNRVRMIAASFLVKDLLIDWRRGEAWFWDTLVDADIAQNAANWQWVAGSGADAAPYFRVFNPVSQGETFDPDGAYVRRWVPELARLPAGLIHAPWTAPPALLAAAGVMLGRDYPRPILDHAQARRRALDAFAALKSAQPEPAA